MKQGMRKAVLILCLAAGMAPATQWERKMEARVQAIRAKYGNGSRPGLARRLVRMEQEDQDVRKRWIAARGKPEEPSLAEEMARTDRKLAAELKSLVEQHGWPTFALAGYAGSAAAGLILIHSPDPAFQQKMLPELMRLVETSQIMGDQVALVTDKVLRSGGRPQRFGTQFSFRDGKAIMEPVEDPERLDARRAQYDLIPMAEYKKILAKLYKVKVE